ncbi:GNAT family N-acetyltransferase [Pseudomonas entomophila]|uniref:GNAT family N-acetyltransferase n=1 Tax=Pseudomonas entomophila TaxID=312306 RepID=UPI0023D88343|nr:GNAT family N-acetyltransferase [Pseudomonas entomophila]MDF0733165.1 GNAT family N-acetyltransferase [Pseudomonas entomophila]
MNPPHYQLLGSDQRRLLDRFYREQGSRMRAVAEGQLWVARAGTLVAGLNLSAVEDGQWLTGLFVAPAWRSQGVAGGLVDAALAGTTTSTWLFCHPDLQRFYQRLGFAATESLPAALTSRLERYRRGKRLVAMARTQSSLGSSPGNSTSV